MSGSNSNSSGAGGGIGVAGLLGVAFVVLRLTRVIRWSWWWVTAPFWAGLALVIVILIIVVFVVTVRAAVTGKPKSRGRLR